VETAVGRGRGRLKPWPFGEKLHGQGPGGRLAPFLQYEVREGREASGAGVPSLIESGSMPVPSQFERG